MGLQDYLQGNIITLSGDPDNVKTFNPELYKSGEGSKRLNYPEDRYGLSQGPLLGKRVTFDSSITKASRPTFEYGGDGYTRHSIDQFVRGGTKYAREAREIDFDRIKKFFGTTNGKLFLEKQVTLQSLNPRPQKVYNYGANTLGSVVAAGVSNIRRGGILTSVGDFDIGSMLGTDKTYLTENEFEGGALHRENNYGLGSPGAPSSQKGLKSLISNINPFGALGGKVGYDVYIDKSIDKVNYLPVFKNKKDIPDFLNSEAKDFVPFRFEVINSIYDPHSSDSHNAGSLIVFRAFLDNISDNYDATHNTIKYNGRGEEFYTYQKFNRKIQISFKIAAQTRWEMRFLYQKLNFLVAQTAPGYTADRRIHTPYCKLTVGDWFNKIPGLITNVGLTWQTNYPWEIALDRKVNPDTGDMEGKDKDMLILPHVLDVSLSFQPIHSFLPEKNIRTPFIGINGDGVNTPDWTSGAEGNVWDYDFSGNPLDQIEGEMEDANATYIPPPSPAPEELPTTFDPNAVGTD